MPASSGALISGAVPAVLGGRKPKSRYGTAAAEESASIGIGSLFLGDINLCAVLWQCFLFPLPPLS
jgi:hypothetical protein